MRLDKKLLDDFHALPPDQQTEVIDFIERLKSKQQDTDDKQSIQKRNLQGALKGKIWMADDFDAPMEDFQDYM